MSRMRVSDVMTTDVVTVCEDTPFREILDKIKVAGVSALPVVDGGNLVLGVVSEADLLPKMEFAGYHGGVRLFEGRRGRNARTKAAGMRARELMTAPAVTVLANCTVAEAARLMDGVGVKQLPIVNVAGRLVGIVARSDLLKAFVRTDDEIAADVRGGCRELPGVEAAQLTTAVDGGMVTVAGRLDRRSLIADVVRCAERVDGVIAVVNRLEYEVDDTQWTPMPIA